MKKLSISILFLFLIFSQAFAIKPQEEGRMRMLVNLLDYIAKDYGMAVSDGEILSEYEYAEMNEFVANAQENYRSLIDSEVFVQTTMMQEKMELLATQIQQKANPEEVSNTANQLKTTLLALNLIALTPTEWPNLERGESLFSANCASCHGTVGAGDGPAGIALTPPPTNFKNKEIMQGVAPFQAFNTITLGIPGTGMRSFQELSQEQIWDLAFYIVSLQHFDQKNAMAKESIELSELATLSDADLLVKYPTIDIAAQRNNPIQQSKNSKLPTQLTRELLAASKSAYSSGNFEEANLFALNAYLQGIEPIEAQVKASDNQLFNELEGTMLNIRSVIKQKANLSEFNKALTEAIVALDKTDALLSQDNRSTTMTAIIAGTILLREGLEAFFVILAILGILKTVNSPTAIRWLHSGWISAVLVGIVGWFFADSLLNLDAQNRELMEGLIGLFSVVVLLYLGFWLHGKTEATKWKDFVENRIKTLITKNNMIGLGAFSFIVVFREAFESVLFLSSLTVNAQSDSKLGVLIGAIGSGIILAIMAWAILKWFKKLPIRKVFLYSSMVILALAFVLAGQGVHAIQEGGYMDIRSFPINLKLSVLGIYPTYETLLSQLLVLVVIGILWKVNSRKATTL